MQNEYRRFPAGFLWGGATSGPQSEGRTDKPHQNVFDYWYDIEPQAFWGQVGPGITSDFYHHYKTDLALLKTLGFNSFRTSIQWTRLIRNFETGEPDETAVRFYQNMIDSVIENGMTPIINLHHFDLPIELYQTYGGWESRHVVDLFARFAETAFRLFGNKVKYWTTFNEPMVIVEGQYLYKFHYPKIVDGKKAMQVLYHLNLASALAVKTYRNSVRGNGKIGIILNLTPTYPKSSSKEDVTAAKIADAIFNTSFLDPAVTGNFSHILTSLLQTDGVLWNTTPRDLTIIRENTVDFLGVNYYQPKRVKAKDAKINQSQGWLPDWYFDHYDMPGKRMNPYRGWEIYPQAMYDIAINLKTNYHNIPWYISENGMGVEDEARYKNDQGLIEDDYRIDFFTEHLTHLHRGIEEGSNCFGFHAWTPIDCWSWCNAYKNRYGYIAVDLATQNRTIKKSGAWIKEVIENNALFIVD